MAAWVPTVVSAALFLPGGPLFDSFALRVAFTALILMAAAATVWLVILAVAIWRDPGTSASRVRAAVVSVASLMTVWAGLFVWVPVAWRSSDHGIERLASRVHEAGILVMPTLVNYDAIGGPGRAQLVRNLMMRYLQPDVRARWLRGPQAGPPGYRYTDFMKKVAGALHRAGVPLLAGAMGFPRVAPGASLHHELRLLIESGLSPYEAMRGHGRARDVLGAGRRVRHRRRREASRSSTGRWQPAAKHQLSRTAGRRHGAWKVVPARTTPTDVGAALIRQMIA